MVEMVEIEYVLKLLIKYNIAYILPCSPNKMVAHSLDYIRIDSPNNNK
jgi:hypothetical protein